MDQRIISIIDHGIGDPPYIVGALVDKLRAAGFSPVMDEVEGAELIIVIGGDGSFLRTLQRFDFPGVPFVGINTGHLGFFQELDREDLDEFIYRYYYGQYRMQNYHTVQGYIEYLDGETTVQGLNEIAIKAADARVAHFDIYIGDNFIENFTGDGVVISTPAGSTAYNYALGGSIVDPRLELLQLTPIAPVNTTAFRSFTSGIVLPPELPVQILFDPESRGGDGKRRETLVAIDGNEVRLPGIQRVVARLSDRSVTLLRFKDYEFWTTVKQKLLTP